MVIENNLIYIYCMMSVRKNPYGHCAIRDRKQNICIPHRFKSENSILSDAVSSVPGVAGRYSENNK